MTIGRNRSPAQLVDLRPSSSIAEVPTGNAPHCFATLHRDTMSALHVPVVVSFSSVHPWVEHLNRISLSDQSVSGDPLPIRLGTTEILMQQLLGSVLRAAVPSCNRRPGFAEAPRVDDLPR